MLLPAVCRVHAVCARWRADRRGPKTPGAGPAGSGQEIRAAGAVRGDRRGAAGQRAVGAAVAAGLAGGGQAGLASRGQAARCRLDERQLAVLDVALEAGPLAAGWEDQRWTLARVRDLVARKFKVQYTVPGIWYLLKRRGWTCQIGARRAIERDDGAVEVWKKETWPRIKGPRRPSAAGSSSKTSAVSR